MVSDASKDEDRSFPPCLKEGPPCSPGRLSELLGLDLGPMDGREGERRLQVTAKASKVRFVPNSRTLTR